MIERRIPEAETFNVTGKKNVKIGLVKTHIAEENKHTAIENSVSVEQALQQVVVLNTHHHLRNEFFNPEYNSNILVRNILPQGGTSTVRPDAPYTDPTLMIVAADSELINGEISLQPSTEEDKELVPTRTIYDFDEGVQELYWRDILQTLQSFEDVVDEKGNTSRYTIFAAENCIRDRSNEEMRTSRSIAIPHTHIIILDDAEVNELHDVSPHIKNVISEQQFLKYIGSSLADRVYENLPDNAKNNLVNTMEVAEGDASDDINLKLRKRMAMPFGYTMQLPQGLSDKEFAEFMREHHEAYSKTAEEMLGILNDGDKKQFIPQPSYRLYIHREKSGDVSLIVSPELFSAGGAIEALGLKLERDEKYPLHYEESMVKDLHQRVEEANKTDDTPDSDTIKSKSSGSVIFVAAVSASL